MKEISEKEKFNIYLTVLRFLAFKITSNLKRIYLNFDLEASKILLTALYINSPTELEVELLDDIVTNSNAHIPDFFVDSKYLLFQDSDKEISYEFVVFATYDE